MVVADSARDLRGGVGGSATALAPDDTAISPEFWGLARLARQHFAGSVAVSQPMKSICLSASAAYSTLRGVIPPRVVTSTHRKWLALSPIGLVLQSIVLTGSRTLTIRDVRATTSTLWKPTWDGQESGICLVDNHLDLRRNRLTGSAPITASVSAHGLARWYIRQAGGTPASLERLTADLATLAAEAPALLAGKPPGVSLSVETQSGAWHGRIETDGLKTWADVRTFY
jgi:hypothetical protein